MRALTLLFGCLALTWGILNLKRGVAEDEFDRLESRLLSFETFSPELAKRIVESPAARDLTACDNHAQRALSLLEIPLADAALRSGNVADFDRHMQSLESRSRQVLACVPRDSMTWLLLFGLEVMHGRLDLHAFELLATSYETSPNEAWVALRRMIVAIPVLLSAPEAVQQKILAEFRNLISHRFVEIPARAYLSAPASARQLLQSQIEKLDPESQNGFADALRKLHS